jgi:alkylation response protein AidB-like acyl-CoA dehydrogenase
MTATQIDPLVEVRAFADELRADAASRDLAAGTPKSQRDSIRRRGLLTLLVPAELGGAGVTWPTLLRCVREIAIADASIAHLFGYHYLGLVTPHLFGTLHQRMYWYRRTVEDGLFWGNALNPLDPRTTLTARPDGSLRLNGAKSFCTGGSDSDLLLVSATLPGVQQLQVAAVPTRRPGITVNDDWDNMGQRQTDSGSVRFSDVVVEPSELLGPPGAGGSALATLRTCVTQSILSNIFLGVGQGALLEAAAYTRKLERPFFGSTAPSAAEDPYVLEHYGDMHVQLSAAAGLLDTAAEELERAWRRDASLTVEERGVCAVAVAMAKVAAGRAALEVTSRMFEVIGARATSTRYRFDRFWRNVRTLTLHDSLDYKVREVGDWFVNGRAPTPSLYS